MSAGQQSPLNASVLNHQTTEESKPNFYKELEEDTNRLFIKSRITKLTYLFLF